MKKNGLLLVFLVIICSNLFNGCIEFNDISNNKLYVDLNYSDSLNQSLYSASDNIIGVAVNIEYLRNNQKYRNIVAYHFNSITPGNAMKMGSLVPREGNYHWSDADLIVDFAEQIDAFVHGHVLVWHNQLPSWISSYSGTAMDWKNLLKTHIQTVVGRYKGRVQSWDVVNEAVLDEGSGYRDTIWKENIGVEYIADAFRWAHEVDPDAELFYNDYSLCANSKKLDFVINMTQSLIEEGVPIHGIGFQMHITDKWPTIDEIQKSIEKIESLKLKLRITELDVSMNYEEKYTIFTNDLAQSQKVRFEEVISLSVKSPNLVGITFWGVSDADSWIPSFFNRLDWPLIFDENYQPKPAAEGCLNALQK